FRRGVPPNDLAPTRATGSILPNDQLGQDAIPAMQAMGTGLTLKQLRRQAAHVTVHAPRTLARAIAQIEFIQSDPIRSPARAQDLILRHRVAEYRVGDLERRYSSLAAEEDYLYAYGFMPRHIRKFLY